MEPVICNNLRKMTAWLYFTTSRFTPSVEHFMIVMLMRFFGLYFSHLRLHSFHYSLTPLASKSFQSSKVSSHFAGQIVLIISAAPDVFLQEFGLLHLPHHIPLGLLFVPPLRLADNLHQSVAYLPGHVRGTANVKCSPLLQ